MGTEISTEDVVRVWTAQQLGLLGDRTPTCATHRLCACSAPQTNIQDLCDQVVDLSEYRAQLFEYLRSRMVAIAPNLTVLVGELVGARLIAHAGSLINLAKQPASTVQILGAEKALFRALKTKHETPKYGLIYHASLIGQSAPK
jgi:nucleolar protein 58